MYVKSVSLYLQKMEQLEKSHHEVYQKILKRISRKKVRRTEKDTAGLTMDLVVEQELMRSLKTSGGLTRGSFRGGMFDAKRQQWILSVTACSSMNKAMQLLTEMQYTSGEQHREISESRKNERH